MFVCVFSVKALVTANELNKSKYYNKINLRENAIINKFNALH